MRAHLGSKFSSASIDSSSLSLDPQFGCAVFSFLPEIQRSAPEPIHGCCCSPLPSSSSNAGRAPARGGVPRTGATEEGAPGGDNTMRRATPGRERRPGPVRGRAGGRGHVRAAAADPGGADGGDQLRGARRVGAVGEAVLPGLHLRRVQPRRRAAAAAHGHQARRGHRRRGPGARQRARVRRRRATPSGAGGRGRPAVRASHFLIQSDHFFLSFFFSFVALRQSATCIVLETCSSSSLSAAGLEQIANQCWIPKTGLGF